MRDSLYDPRLPSSLKRTQQWFGPIISTPLADNDKITSNTPSGGSIESEACLYIRPSKTLKAHERIQIYNQQYWWRLINILQDSAPLITRLFGYESFNREIAVPYLTKYPPKDWSLNPLVSNLAQWVDEEYNQEDKELIYNAARIDCANNDSFFVKELPPLKNLSQEDLNTILQTPLQIQHHIHLFELPYDLFNFRVELLKEKVKYWEENDFPKLQHGDFFFVLYRGLDNNIHWESISQGEHFLLQYFQEGSSIETACAFLENQDKKVRQDALDNLKEWFETWVKREWLCPLH